MVGGRIVEVVEEEEVEGKVEEEEKDKEEEIVEVEEHPSGQGTASTDTSFPHFTITNRQHSLPLTCQTLFLSTKTSSHQPLRGYSMINIFTRLKTINEICPVLKFECPEP